MEIVAVVPYRSIRIENGKISLCDVFPRFHSLRSGDVVVFSVAVVMLTEEGDRGTYPLTIGIRGTEGETLYESVSDVPAGSPGYYTMQIETVTAEVAGPGLYHLDVTLDDKDFFILPLIFFEKENS